MKTLNFDVADHLRTPEEMEAYLEACTEIAEGDSAFIEKVKTDISRAQGKQSIIKHITPAGGNVFADLGFPPEEAAALKV